jgi:hypothetical protein
MVSGQAEAAQRVNGYIEKNGTYVSPSYRSKADGVRFNNYSTKGNSNPFTGKKGYAPAIKPLKIGR